MKKLLLLTALLIPGFAQAQFIKQSKSVQVSFAPDTAAYSAGDSVGGDLVFEKILCGRTKRGIVRGVTIADTEKQDVDYDLICKTAAFAASSVVDNSAFTPTDTELLTLMPPITLTDLYSFADNGMLSLSSLSSVVRSSTADSTSGEGNLYCALVTGGAPDWAAAQTVAVTITVECD